jgi:hypothetical protein
MHPIFSTHSSFIDALALINLLDYFENNNSPSRTIRFFLLLVLPPLLLIPHSVSWRWLSKEPNYVTFLSIFVTISTNLVSSPKSFQLFSHSTLHILCTDLISSSSKTSSAPLSMCHFSIRSNHLGGHRLAITSLESSLRQQFKRSFNLILRYHPPPPLQIRISSLIHNNRIN